MSLTKPILNKIRNKGFDKLLLEEVQSFNKSIDEYSRAIVLVGTLFEDLVFYYVGLVNGHDINNLVPILKKLRYSPNNNPVLLHINTSKGMG